MELISYPGLCFAFSYFFAKRSIYDLKALSAKGWWESEEFNISMFSFRISDSLQQARFALIEN